MSKPSPRHRARVDDGYRSQPVVSVEVGSRIESVRDPPVIELSVISDNGAARRTRNSRQPSNAEVETREVAERNRLADCSTWRLAFHENAMRFRACSQASADTTC